MSFMKHVSNIELWCYYKPFRNNRVDPDGKLIFYFLIISDNFHFIQISRHYFVNPSSLDKGGVIQGILKFYAFILLLTIYNTSYDNQIKYTSTHTNSEILCRPIVFLFLEIYLESCKRQRTFFSSLTIEYKPLNH